MFALPLFIISIYEYTTGTDTNFYQEGGGGEICLPLPLPSCTHIINILCKNVTIYDFCQPQFHFCFRAQFLLFSKQVRKIDSKFEKMLNEWMIRYTYTDAYSGGGAGTCRPPPRRLGGSPPPPGFWYPLFLVLNGMTFEGQLRKLSDKFRIQIL